MTKLITLFLFSITIISCKSITLEEIVNKKIEIFEMYEDEYFQEISIHLERKSGILYEHKTFIAYRSKQFDSIETYAVFETKPEFNIPKNFRNIPIDLLFVQIFHKIDCYRLSNVGDTTFIQFFFNKERYTLFRGEKQPLLYLSNKKIIRINEQWSLVKYNDGEQE